MLPKFTPPMKKTPLQYWAVMATAVIAAIQTANAGNKIWTAASGVDTNWSTGNNWSPSGSPGTADGTRFFDAGSTNSNANISSVVSANTTVHSLIFGQTNATELHNLYINPGVTLTVSGTNN